MSARLLAKVRDAGVEIEVRGDDLAVKAPPGVLTPDRVARIREHKAALLELVKAEAATLPKSAQGSAAEATQRFVPWVDRPDVATVVEDLADEGKRPGQISRLLGLRRDEVTAILRRTGR